MNRVWRRIPPATLSQELIELTGGDPVVAQLLAQRGFATPAAARAFLHPEHYSPSAPQALYGLEHAASVLVDELNRGHNILVWGDFDVDGQTSTALLYSALKRLAGPDRVRYHVPNRFREGHGIRVAKLQELLSAPDFRPHCLITCDTGISDGPAIGYAKDEGLTVIVTDHHDPEPDLLELARDGRPIWAGDPRIVGQDSVRRSDAITDPKFQPHDPLASLPGVGVAYKLIESLFAQTGHAGEEIEYLDLVALGIVADVAEQVGDTRYLLQLGLCRIRQTRRTGLLALMHVAGVAPETVDAEAIGFQLGPRMNALGRLEDASDAVELLTTADPVRAGQLAAKMERLNQQRRLLTSQITGAALTMVEHRPHLLDRNALVLGHEAWHPGIVGIVAARMVEEFNKPAVLLVIPADGPARGSARSIPSVDIGASIAACSPILTQFGGHPGAAGVTLPKENIEHFRELLHQQVAVHAIPGADDLLAIDSELSLDQATIGLVERLSLLAPFGNGNPMPTFATPALRVTSERRIGKQEDHRRLQVTDRTNADRTVLWWNAGDNMLPQQPIDLAYTVGINEYRGARTVQLVYVDSRRSHVDAAEHDVDQGESVIVRDLRQQAVAAEELPQPAAAAWYVEGVHVARLAGSPAYAPRYDLSPDAAHTLVVWSSPPAPEILLWMQETLRPGEIVLCANNTADDSLPNVVRQVAGMCKYALDRDGVLHIDRMAARLATTEAVIRRSLLWLEANGAIVLGDWQETDGLRVQPGLGGPPHEEQVPAKAHLQAELEEELAEVRAYRRFYQRANVDALGLRGRLSVAE